MLAVVCHRSFLEGAGPIIVVFENLIIPKTCLWGFRVWRRGWKHHRRRLLSFCSNTEWITKHHFSRRRLSGKPKPFQERTAAFHESSGTRPRWPWVCKPSQWTFVSNTGKPQSNTDIHKIPTRNSTHFFRNVWAQSGTVWEVGDKSLLWQPQQQTTIPLTFFILQFGTFRRLWMNLQNYCFRMSGTKAPTSRRIRADQWYS